VGVPAFVVVVVDVVEVVDFVLGIVVEVVVMEVVVEGFKGSSVVVVVGLQYAPQVSFSSSTSYLFIKSLSSSSVMAKTPYG